MKQELINLLATFKYPVRLQGSLAPKEKYPDSFFTIWNNSVDDGSHYDNDAINFVWDFTIYFYSVNPALVNTVLVEAKALLKQNGWIVGGKGYDVASDEPTHTGRAIDAVYIERNIITGGQNNAEQSSSGNS